jgi:hypothetical protein
MLVAGLLAKSGATMVGLAMGFVAYQQTESAFVVAVVAAAFGLGFAASSLSPDTSSSAPACARCSSAR